MSMQMVRSNPDESIFSNLRTRGWNRKTCGAVIGLVEAFSPQWVSVLLGFTGIAGLLAMTAFKVGYIVGQEESGCVVYWLSSPSGKVK